MFGEKNKEFRNTVKEQVREQFLKEGKKKRDQELVVKMFNKGMPVQDISKYTDISESEILNILNMQN